MSTSFHFDASFRFSVRRLFCSRAPDLVKNKEQHQRHAAPNENDFFLPIMPDDRDIVLHIRITIKNWWRLRQMRIPASRKMIRARVNPTRSTGTPACAIVAMSGYLVSAKHVHFGLRFVL